MMGWGCYKHEWDAGSHDWEVYAERLCNDRLKSHSDWGRDGQVCPKCYEEELADKDKKIAELRKRTHETAHKRDKAEAQIQSELAGWNQMRDDAKAYIGDRMHSGECRLDWFACLHFMAERDDANAKLAARLERTESTCSSVLADMGIARDPMCDTGLAQLQVIASYQCGELMALREVLEAVLEEHSAREKAIEDGDCVESMLYAELEERIRSALADDAGKAVTEDEIEEAAAAEIKRQLSDDAGKKEVG